MHPAKNYSLLEALNSRLNIGLVFFSAEGGVFFFFPFFSFLILLLNLIGSSSL